MNCSVELGYGVFVLVCYIFKSSFQISILYIRQNIYIDILAPNFMRHRRWNFIRRRDFEFFRDLDRDGFEPGWAPLFYFDLGSSYIKKPESRLKANNISESAA